MPLHTTFKGRSRHFNIDFDFDDWFDGSVVVAEDDSPLMVFHGTSSIFDHFRPLSHFGSDAAAHRVMYDDEEKLSDHDYVRKSNEMLFQSRLASRQVVRVQHPVFLNIKNPVELEDFGSHESGLDFINQLFHEGIISEDERMSLASERMRPSLNADHISQMQSEGHFSEQDSMLDHYWKYKVVKKLEEKGYDGIIYKNQIEDEGSTSFIIFHPDQVMPANFVDRQASKSFVSNVKRYMGNIYPDTARPKYTPDDFKHKPEEPASQEPA